jgi:CheY-like chemotaxis protein
MLVKFKEVQILIVEDDEQSRDLLLDRLEIMGMGVKNIFTCENGKSALNKLKFYKFDLIICDWNLPYMNGLEFFQVAKKENLFGKAPFLMVSAENQKDRITLAIKGGVQHYLIKPFSQQKFEEEVKTLLKV